MKNIKNFFQRIGIIPHKHVWDTNNPMWECYNNKKKGFWIYPCKEKGCNTVISKEFYEKKK